MRRATVHLRHPRFLVVLGAILLLLAIAPAFTAANIDNETRSAGESTDTVSGYTLSSTSVSLNATTPSNVDSVSFTAAGDAKPAVAKAKFAAAGTFYDCTVGAELVSPWTITCDTTVGTQLTVLDFVAFDVILAN